MENALRRGGRLFWDWTPIGVWEAFLGKWSVLVDSHSGIQHHLGQRASCLISLDVAELLQVVNDPEDTHGWYLLGMGIRHLWRIIVQKATLKNSTEPVRG